MPSIIEIAWGQIGVSRKTAEGRKIVNGYIWLSTKYPSQVSKSASWCGHFAYWVLYWAYNGNEDKLPEKAGQIDGKKDWNTISRFVDAYEQTSTPERGDLYYCPVHPKFGAVHHIGFVEDPMDGEASFGSLNGNGRGGAVSFDITPRKNVKYFLSVPK